jgi:hypothetical protein
MLRHFTDVESEFAIEALNRAREDLEIALERCEAVTRPDIECTIQKIERVFALLKARGVNPHKSPRLPSPPHSEMS